MEKTLTIKERLRLHKLWLADDQSGVRFVEHGDELMAADLRHVDLRRADLRGADIRWADLSHAFLSGADIRDADLRWANITGTDLVEANIQGCNIDFAAWPLWCGSKGVKTGVAIFRQLVDHLLVIDADDDEVRKVQEWLLANACRSHHAVDLGLVPG